MLLGVFKQRAPPPRGSLVMTDLLQQLLVGHPPKLFEPETSSIVNRATAGTEHLRAKLARQLGDPFEGLLDVGD